jgi:CDGSH-type Zn-finger protein
MTENPEKKVKVTKNGPYIVCGNMPLSEQNIINDEEGYPEKWKEGKKFDLKEGCALCRCGNSKNKPFCDSTHKKINFDGEETADFEEYESSAEITEGPKLILKDNPALCAAAGFCHRMSGTWNLTKESKNEKFKEEAIRQACNCPSGRLVACDKKTGKSIEPELKPSIGLVEYPDEKISGPIWLKGKIPLESSEGRVYESRNRMTLCRCGKSKNKPFCDGTHVSINFNSEE